MSSKVSCKSSTFSFANGSKLRSLESDFSEALHSVLFDGKADNLK